MDDRWLVSGEPKPLFAGSIGMLIFSFYVTHLRGKLRLIFGHLTVERRNAKDGREVSIKILVCPLILLLDRMALNASISSTHLFPMSARLPLYLLIIQRTPLSKDDKDDSDNIVCPILRYSFDLCFHMCQRLFERTDTLLMTLTMLRKFCVIENNPLLIDPFPGVIFAIDHGKVFACVSSLPLYIRQRIQTVSIFTAVVSPLVMCE
jgi:hypothetical protein